MIEPQDALAKGAPALHDDVPDNLAMDYEYGDQAATDEAFAKATHVVKRDAARAAHRRQPDGAEVRASRATMPPAACSTSTCRRKGMADIKTALATITGLPPEKFRIHSNDVGGGFGVRNEVYPEFLAVMLAAQATGPAGEMDRHALGNDRRAIITRARPT